MRCSHRAAHPLRRETLSALWADSAPERRTERALPGARARARSRGRVAPVCGPRGPPRRNARRGVPAPSAVCGPAPGVASSLAAAPVARPPSAFCALRPGSPAWRAAVRAPLVARGLARPARSAGGARPPRWLAPRAGLRSVGLPVRSPSSAPPVPVVLPLCGPGCSPFRGPPVPRGASPRAPVPRLRSTRRGARAACGPRLWGALRPRRGYGRFLLGLCLCACRCACRWVVPHGGPPWAARAALAGGNGIQKVLRMGRTNDRRRDRAGDAVRPPGGWFRALPAPLLSTIQSVLLDLYY